MEFRKQEKRKRVRTLRDSESDKKRYKQGKDALSRLDISNDRPCLTEEEVDKICSTGLFTVVDQEAKQSGFNRARKRVMECFEARKVCAVCDRSFRLTNIVRSPLSQKDIENWCHNLRGSDRVPTVLRQFYSIASDIPSLEGILLSRSGIEIDDSLRLGLRVLRCRQCNASLKKRGNPPKFSIANGFDIGVLPDMFKDARAIEFRMTSMTSVASSVLILKGAHRAVKGHVIVFRTNPTTIARRLPKLIAATEDTFLVIIAGKLTTAQRVLGLKKHVARHSMIRKLLSFFVRNNVLYKKYEVSLDCSAIDTLLGRDPPVGPTIERIEVPESDLVQREEPISDNSGQLTYHETTTMHINPAPLTTLESIESAKKTLLVRNESAFLSEYDRDLFALAYPELFPFGRGHPGTERDVPVSMEECCRYYLDLSDRRFAQHPTFPLVAFDVCGKHRAARFTTIRSIGNQGEFEKIANVTAEELSDALELKRSAKRNAQRSQFFRNTNTKVDSLFRNVRISQAQMWASSEERLQYRRKAFSMDSFLKTGSPFVTITPSDVNTLLVAWHAGEITHESFSRHEMEKFPDHVTRQAIAVKDPVACAQYFEEICNVFIEDMIGFNMSKGLPYRGGGIFGHVRAFLGVVETQNSGTLHLHAIVFVAGLPRTVKSFKAHCNSDEFKTRFCDLVDSVISNSLPLAEELASLPCPSCREKGKIEVLPKVSRAVRKRGLSQILPLPMSACLCCKKTFGGCEVLRLAVKELQKRIDSGNKHTKHQIPFGRCSREDDRLTEQHCLVPQNVIWPPCGESLSSFSMKVHRLRLSRVLLSTQQHNYRHVNSCFKSSLAARIGECRYSFPRSRQKETYIDDNHCLMIQRDAHNEYINTYNDVMALAFSTNHDIRFLIGGTTDALYYCMKYVTKIPREGTETERVLMKSFERREKMEREKKEEGEQIPCYKAGRARVNSMVMAITKQQQVSAPMCAFYLRKKSGLIASHNFVPLLLSQSICIIRNEEHERDFVLTTRKRFVQAPQLLDYIHRHYSLKHLCMMEFVSRYVRVKNVRDADEATLVFREQHPLSTSHSLRRRKVRAIPDTVGPRIPNNEDLRDETKKETYGLIALILFMPFGSIEEVHCGCSSFWEGFQKAKRDGLLDTRSLEILDNFQEYYVSKHAAEVYRTLLSAQNDFHLDNDPDAIASTLEHEGSQSESQTLADNSEQQEEISDLIESGGIQSMFRSSMGRYESTENVELCVRARARHEIDASSSQSRSIFVLSSEEASNDGAASRMEIEKMKQHVENGNVETERDSEMSCNGLMEDSTTVEYLYSALHSQTRPSLAEHSYCSHFPSVEDVISKFSLNHLQSIAFRIIAKALLVRMSETARSGSSRFLFYLGGEGGTGKTRIIEATLYLAKMWGRATAVRTCAPTGRAAALVKGQTLHSFLGIKAKHSFDIRKRLPRRTLEDNARTLMVVVDEVSMLNAKYLGLLDCFLRKAKENESVEFGGVAVVLSGDFFQIPPVASDPLYSKLPYSEEFDSQKHIMHLSGTRLWHLLDQCIILRESVRQRGDNSFVQCLRRVRKGAMNKSDLALLNSRVIDLDKSSKLQDFKEAPLVVRNNDMRTFLNWKVIKESSEKSRVRPIVIIAEVYDSSGGLINGNQLSQMLRLNDSKTGSMSLILPLVPQMPIRISQNVAVRLGISNGTDGRLIGIRFSKETRFKDVNIFGVDCRLASRLPEVAYIESGMFKNTIPHRFESIPSSFADNVCPLVPFRIDNVRIKSETATRGRTYRITQLPFVPAYSSTVYKIQGSTMDAIVVFPLSRERGPVPFAALYVVLSRVRSVKDLFLIEKIDGEHLELYKPPESLLHEEKRLEWIHNSTVEKLQVEFSCGRGWS